MRCHELKAFPRLLPHRQPQLSRHHRWPATCRVAIVYAPSVEGAMRLEICQGGRKAANERNCKKMNTYQEIQPQTYPSPQRAKTMTHSWPPVLLCENRFILYSKMFHMSVSCWVVTVFFVIQWKLMPSPIYYDTFKHRLVLQSHLIDRILRTSVIVRPD